MSQKKAANPMDQFSPMTLALREAWNESNWAGLPGEVFQSLVAMFPTFAQELVVVRVGSDSKVYGYMSQRPANDFYYSGMLHFPGTSQWPVDGVVEEASKYAPGYEFIPESVVAAEKAKPTWNMTARQKALFRLLTRELGLEPEMATGVIRDILMVGMLEPSQRLRGMEANYINLLILNEELEESVNASEGHRWVALEQLFDMAQEGKVILHHVDIAAIVAESLHSLDLGVEVPALRKL